MRDHLLGMFVWLVAAGAVQAEVVLYDFEKDAEIDAWRAPAFGGQPLAAENLIRSLRFATSGKSSMALTIAAKQQDDRSLLLVVAKPTVSDWRSYDRLVIDITNPTHEQWYFSCSISDSSMFGVGDVQTVLPAPGFKRFVIPLASFSAAFDRSKIVHIHFCLFSRRGTGATIYLDNFKLLEPEEKVPGVPAAFAGQLPELFGGWGSLDDTLQRCRDAVRELSPAGEPSQRVNPRLGSILQRVEAIRNDLNSPTIAVARLDEIQRQLAQLPTMLPARAASVVRFEKAFDRAGFSDSPIMVGLATSMEKILPRDVPFELTVAKDIDVSLARNEKESFQVAVMPRQRALKKVSVTLGDLKSDTDEVFPAQNIDCDVVGYVETKRRPPYRVSYVGWWPDPILDFLGPVDVAPDDVQAFWIRLRALKDQAPGVYRGTIQVSAEGVQPFSFGLTVRVYSFTLPDHAPLPTAITFGERKAQMGGEENWHEMKLKYADFLADYYIDYDSLYRSGSPDYEIVKRLHDQGRLVAFNLGNVFNAGTKAEGFEQAIADTVTRIRPAYEKAKGLGLLDHAYIYGFDERPEEQFMFLEQSAQALKKAFPEVLLMTTSYDHSYGLESVVKTMDAWCPLTPRFDRQQAAEARAQGKKVWWYICCGPHNPHANWFVEYAAIESRLLMGAMTAKCRPDGFLYYSLAIWNDNQPIQSGPFTDWDPVSWTTYHGDGSLLCSGPGGKPVPTIRLENYRDGLEDFAYARILQEIIRRYEAKRETLSPEEVARGSQGRVARAGESGKNNGRVLPRSEGAVRLSAPAGGTDRPFRNAGRAPLGGFQRSRVPGALILSRG